ncbi:hypothetical protein ACN4EE_22250, partial [Geminocystis sp. CENA526]|uniref:hypothetical protein n=1 Tax=Geminocystis sp. CENA526 TaxID=1355871 RepID=UPI003D6E8C45
MFFKYLGVNSYIYSKKDKLTTKEDFDNENNISLPIIIDTEFFNDKRIGITVQIKGIHEDKGIIYCHKDFEKYCIKNNLKPRHKTIREDLAVIDYLKDLGYEINFIKCEYEDLEVTKTVFIDLYAHFAIAELLLVVNGELKENLKDILRKNKDYGLHTNTGEFAKIEQTRRLKFTAQTKKNEPIKNKSDSIATQYQLELNGHWYKVRLRFFDTFGLHGISSYKNLAESTNVNLEFKDDLTQWDKENMNKTYFNKPDDFDNYSLGDLEIYKILVNNAELFKQIYSSLQLDDYYKIPSLTMGKTSEQLFTAKLLSYFNLDDTKDNLKLIKKLCSYGSSNNLKQDVTTTTALLSKVFGGRCRNNTPLTHYIDGLLCDIDIDGCYGNGLRLQKYPIGKPIIESYSINEINQYKTLRQWLNERKYETKDNELVYGLWHCIIDFDGEVKYSQDFLASWFNFKYKDLKTITPIQDDEPTEINSKSGITKIFRYEIKNAVINDDFLDYLFYICNKNQRTELLDNLVIKSAIYYPKFSECKDLAELEEKLGYDCTKQSTKKNIKTVITEIKSAWLSIDLDKFLIDDLLAFRKLYPKKTPLNTLYKLVINSLYGVFCSPFFDTSNCVVGNNITARARLMCYLLEKSLNGNQSITDGVLFDVNKVVYPIQSKRLTAISTVDLYRYSDKNKSLFKHIKLKPLDNAESINFDGEIAIIKYSDKEDLTLNKDDFKLWIADKSIEHLQQVFHPNIRVIHQLSTSINVNKTTKEKICSDKKGMFNLEVKDFYKCAYLHGSANYLFIDFNNELKIGFRSYQNQKHKSFTMQNNKLTESNFYDEQSPSMTFISQLNNDLIERGKVFLKKGILKVNEYSNNAEKFDKLGLCVGDTYYKTGLLREFSQSQLTFNTIEQYTKIDKEITRNKAKYGQSYEFYFTNEDNLLN